MRDEEKTKVQLIKELSVLRQRLEELERDLARHKVTAEGARKGEEKMAFHAGFASLEAELRGSSINPAGLLSAQGRMDEVLQESETKFRMLVERMPDAIAYIHALDESNTLLYTSPQVEKVLGYTVRELQQDSGGWLNCIHPEDHERVLAKFERCQGTGQNFVAEYRVIKKDGEVVWLHDVADMLRDENGRITSIIGVAFDISPLKRAEEALRASEARYRNIFEHATEGIFQSTPEGRYLSINPAFARIFGYSSEKEMMAAISDIGVQIYVYPEDRERIKKLLTEKGRVEKFETQVYRPDGRIIWISSNARLVRDATAATLYYEGTIEDITERKRAEEELQKLASVVRRSSEYINLATLDGKMTFLNDAGGRVLGIDPEEVKQTNIMEVIPDHLQETVQNELLPTVFEHGSWEGDLQCRNLKTGKLTDVFVMAFTITAPDTGAPMFLANISVDITERKEMESTLRERERELEAKSLDLEETNTALRVLLKRREEDQQDFAASMLSNLKELVFPYLKKLRNSPLNDLQKTYLSVVESHLEEIGAPFLRQLSREFTNLSRTERQIASLIREGKRNKEISEILGVSVNTILTHRYHLRTKLGLKNKNINLISYLKSISTF